MDYGKSFFEFNSLLAGHDSRSGSFTLNSSDLIEFRGGGGIFLDASASFELDTVWLCNWVESYSFFFECDTLIFDDARVHGAVIGCVVSRLGDSGLNATVLVPEVYHFKS